MQLSRVFVLEIPRHLTCGNFISKVTGSKALISMKQDSTREKIWRITLLLKSSFKAIEKEKLSRMFSLTCSLLKMDVFSDHFLENFIKYQPKTTVWRQIRSEQILFSITVLKHCIIVKDNSFLESTQNQRCFNVKFRRWFNVDKLTLFRRWNTVIFLMLI